jgi:hypothetical protein
MEIEEMTERLLAKLEDKMNAKMDFYQEKAEASMEKFEEKLGRLPQEDKGQLRCPSRKDGD